MKNIRHSVFETNSSSTHSISINSNSNSNGLYDSILPNKDGILELQGGEFGWEWKKYNDPITKANYVAIYSLFANSNTDMLIEVLKDHTGAKEIFFNFSVDHDNIGVNYSYIDHQSYDIAKKAFESKETLKEFIFNSNSWLFTGNDNDVEPPNFYDVDSNIKYKYEICLPNAKESLKFKKKPSKNDLIEGLTNLIYRDKILTPINGRQSYRLITTKQKDIDGNIMFSFGSLNKNIIILYNIEILYSKEREFLGEKVLSTKEIEFTINKLSK